MSALAINFQQAAQALEDALAPRRSHRLPAEATLAQRWAADAALVTEGTVTEQQLCALYSQAYGREQPDENELTAPDPYPGAALEFLTANRCVPYEWTEESITFLVSDPYGLANLAYLVRRTWKLAFDFRFVRRTFLERLLAKLQTSEDEEHLADVAAHDPDDENALRSMAGEARIVRLVNDIFTRAVETGASDIHVEPGEDLLSVRCRIDGVLSEIMTCPLKDFPAIASRIKLLGGLNIAESRLPQDGRTNIRLGHDALDMRISTIPILTGESIVLRLLNRDAVTFNLETLGMSPELLEKFRRLISIPHGMILVVGPTGSGKTTTLYSVLNLLNDHKRKIITIEDPVEYKTPGICQMQVNPKIGVTFAAGLRHIVRQDPDIVLVGEIRDRETADIAVNAALTGHLVLSTLHTNDAAGAVTRLLDMGMEPFLVSSALFGVLSQRLVRKICPVCGGHRQDAAAGRCRRCNGTGYKGRCGIYELMMVNDEIRAAVNRESDSGELREIAVRHGMKPLLEDGEDKIRAGITTREEVNRSAAENA